MYKAVIFDLDGTLVYTLEDLKNAINLALEIKGYPYQYNLEETKGLIGSGTKVLCQRAIKKDSVTEDEWMDLFLEFSRQYKIHQLDNVALYDGILDLIKQLKDDGYKIAVLSNKVDKNTKDIISYLFKDNPFDYILGQLENMPLKPDPEGLYRVLKELDLKEDEILYIGDSDTDMKTGINARVDVCAVTWGFRNRDILASYNPKYLINSPKELCKILKK